jgi:capsular polysaccharide biosynthesis protein
MTKRAQQQPQIELANSSQIPPPARIGPAEEVLHAIRARWPVIILAMVVGALAAWLIGSMQPKRYRASSVVAVIPRPDALAAEDQIRGIQALDERTIVATIAALPSMPGVTDAIAGNYSVRAVVLPNTNLLRIDVDGGDPSRAAAIANQVPAVLSTRTRAIFGLYSVVTVSTATGGDLVFPRIERIVAGGLVVGLILGVTLAWILSTRKPARP